MENGHNPPPDERPAPLATQVYTPPTLTISGRASRELDWERALRILEKNWRLSAVFAFAALVILTLLAFKMPPVYEPTARLEIDPPGTEELSLKELLNAQNDDQDYLRTQVEILKSDELAVAVIRTLRLDQNAEFAGVHGLAGGLVLPAPEPSGEHQLSPFESKTLRKFRDRLQVTQIQGSRLVEVSFASHDARLAAEVTNTLVKLFIDRNYRTRYEATMQASEWLSAQLSDLRQKVERSNQALVDYQRANGLVDLEQKENTFTQKMADLNHQLAQAQADRIQAEADLRIAQSGGATLSGTGNNQLLQALTEKLVEGRAQLAQALTIYGARNSNVRKLESETGELQSQVNAERDRERNELASRYSAAVAREQMTAQALDAMKGLASSMNEKMVRYNVMKNDAKTTSDLYNSLLARLKEAGISAGLKSSNIRVVDAARVLDKPTRPDRPLDIALGLCLGIFGGLALAFLKENLHNTVATPDDIREWTGLGSLAMLPRVESWNGHGGRRLAIGRVKLLGNGKAKRTPRAPEAGFFFEHPRSAEAEALRTLHTSLMLSRPGRAPRVTLVVSPSPREGKTTVAINLATAFAQHGRTCLVDADLRRPSIARHFKASSKLGLSNVLTGSMELDAALVEAPAVANLVILPAGPLPPNPGDLISSEQMREVLGSLRARFDFVMIDSPPIIPFADARALSSSSDGVVLVGRAGETTRQALKRAIEILTGVHAPILGVVLNAVDLNSPDYHYYHYGYQRHPYAYQSMYEDAPGDSGADEPGHR